MISVYIYFGLPRLDDGKMDRVPEKKIFLIPISAGTSVPGEELGQLCLFLPSPVKADPVGPGTVEVTTLKLFVDLVARFGVREELLRRAVRRVLLQELLDEGPLRLQSTCCIEAG